MSKILQQNGLENGKQNCSNDSLDNQSMILEFALFDRKIGTELHHYHVSFSQALKHWIFIRSTNQNTHLLKQCSVYYLDGTYHRVASSNVCY